MIRRAFIHAGPAGCGKTTFVEALLTAGDSPMVVGRCTRDDSVRRMRSRRRHVIPNYNAIVGRAPGRALCSPFRATMRIWWTFTSRD